MIKVNRTYAQALLYAQTVENSALEQIKLLCSQEFTKVAKDRIKYTVDFVEDVTKIKDFGKYLTAKLEIDAFFLNEDRHTNNIAIIRNPSTNEFSLCPYFDQGLSLLSDLDGFWLDGDTEKHISRGIAKPFGTFKSQVSAAWELYGKQLDVRFTMDDVNNILDEMKEYYNDEILNRGMFIIKKQIEKYQRVIICHMLQQLYYQLF